MKSGSVLAHARPSSPRGSSALHLSREAGGRAQVRQAPPTWEPRGSPSAAAAPSAPCPRGDAPARPPGPRSWGSGEEAESSRPALAEVATVLPLVPRWSAPKRKAAPRRTMNPPVLKEGGCGAPVSTRKTGSSSDKGSPPPYGEPERLSPAAAPQALGPDAEQRPETCAQRPLPWPSPPAPPPPPAHYLGSPRRPRRRWPRSVR